MATTPDHDLPQSEHLPRTPGGRIGLIIAGSLAAGLVTALVLVAAPFIPAQEGALTGVVLLGFAFGWALLAVLSVRFSDQPQRWAAAPAVFFALAGLISLLPPGSVLQKGFGWVWPPLLLGLVVWMFVRAHRQLRSRRWLVYPLLVVLGLASIGGGYETVRESIDATAYPAPGQLIDVGGHRLHLNCTGSGSPTVVLEPGHGEVSSAMGWIAPAVARDSRVCVYDRAGRGSSDPADGPQDAAQTAADLHTLLDRGHIPGPYVLAGHSFGGLYVLTFAATYPDQVAGLVLLDSTAPVPGPVPTSKAGSYDLVGRISALLPAVAHLGAAHLIGDSYDSLPPRSRNEARATVSTAHSVGSYLNEFFVGSRSTHQAASLVDFAGKPLIVVTAGREHDAAWMAAQDKLATLSTNSRHDVVADATHASLVLNETGAAAASRAIRDVVAAVRTSRPLA
ncbi:MAG TPA: alpha/beta hydrolase [Propionibacteriaceae bacterium]|nr:alpha/beta hydrolase [Propionibacteriaceae bacterium]